MVPRMLPDWIGKVAAVVTLLLVALLSMPSGNEEGGAQSNGQSLRYSQGLLVGRRHRHAGQRQSRESELQGHLYRGWRERLAGHALRRNRL